MKENKLYEAIRGGDYNCMPNVLREFFILVGDYQNQSTLTVCRYARPTLLEFAVYKFRLQGIKIELINEEHNSETIFSHFYKIKIDIPAFLSNLLIFYKTTEEQLQARYGKPKEAWEDALIRIRGIQRNNNANGQNKKHQEIVLYSTRVITIGILKKLSNTQST